MELKDTREREPVFVALANPFLSTGCPKKKKTFYVSKKLLKIRFESTRDKLKACTYLILEPTVFFSFVQVRSQDFFPKGGLTQNLPEAPSVSELFLNDI